MSVERHHVQEENVGAYLLGALTDVELRAFEGHIEECPICREEVERLRPAAEALPRSVVPVSPPPRLKASVMEAVQAEARSREGAGRRRPLAALRERLAAAGEGFGALGPAAAALSACFVLAAGGLGGYALTRVSSGDEDSQVLSAKIDKQRVPLESGSLVVPGDRDKGAILRVHGMPTLEEGSVYQLWLQRDGEVISQSLFSVGQDGKGAAAVAEDLAGADAVLVTREQAGGARAPSESPVLRVAL